MEYNGSVMDGFHSIMLKTRARPHLLKVSAQALAVLVFLYFLNAFVQTDYLHPLHTMAELAFGIIWLLFCYIVSRTFGIMTILALSFASTIAWGLFIESIPVSDFSSFHRAAARLSMGEFAYLFSEKSPTAIAYYAIFHWLLGSTYVTNYIASSVAWTGGAALTYKALRSFFDDERKVKFVCVGLAFCPTFVVFSPVISSESVFFLLSSVCAWLISRHLVGGGSFPYLYIAVGMAAAGLFFTRANGVLALLLCILVVGLGRVRSSTEIEQEDSERKTRSFRHPMALCAIVLVAFSVVWFAYGYLSWSSGQGFQISSAKRGSLYLLFGTNFDRGGRYNVADMELAGYRGENKLPLAQANERAKKIAVERIANDPVRFVSFSMTDKVAQLWGREYGLFGWALGDRARTEKLYQLKSSISALDVSKVAESVTSPMQPLSLRVWPLVFISLDGVYRLTFLLFLVMLIGQILRPSNYLALGMIVFLLSIPHILIEVQPRYHLAMTPFIVVGSMLLAYDLWSRRSEWFAVVRRQWHTSLGNRAA